MVISRLRSLAIAGAAVAACVGSPLIGVGQQRSQISQSTQADSVDLDVLMRGPVHEGFAEPAASASPDRERLGTLELPEPIPDPIDETPAMAQPTDPQREAVWIPGYWGVEESNQLCWVSGSWRFAPPGMQWVPGYWAELDAGYRWVPGFWVEQSLEQVSYLPAPPAPPADFVEYREPQDGRFWVPGKYVWNNGDYVWVEGFWADANPQWVWVPHRLVSTPRGYIQVDGYWDYPVERRGTLFAPVRFRQVARISRPYRPSVVINVRHALASLFVHPHYDHYYFGNYYGDQYRSFGLQPWGPYAQNVRTYDPLFAYYSTTQAGFLRDLVNVRQQYVNDVDRFPVTYNEYEQFVANQPQQSSLGALARSVQQLATGETFDGFDNLRVRDASEAKAFDSEMQERVESLRRFTQGRRDVESNLTGRNAPNRQSQDRDSIRDRIEDRREDRGDRREERRDDLEDRLEEGREQREERREEMRERAEDRREDRAERREEPSERAEDRRDRAEELRERAEDRGEDASEEARERAEDLRERQREARERVQEGGDRIGNRAEQRREAMRDRAENALDRGSDAARDAREQARNQFDLRPYRSQRPTRDPQSPTGNRGGDASDRDGQLSPPARLDRPRGQRGSDRNPAAGTSPRGSQRGNDANLNRGSNRPAPQGNQPSAGSAASPSPTRGSASPSPRAPSSAAPSASASGSASGAASGSAAKSASGGASGNASAAAEAAKSKKSDE